MVLMCLPSDALLQHLLSYLGFSYLGPWVSLHGCSRKVQPLLLTLDEGYLLMATPPDLGPGVAPLGLPTPTQPPSDRMWSTGEGNGKPLQCSCLENPMNSMKRQNDRMPKEELPRLVGAQYATGDQWRNNSRKNEGTDPKQK